MSESEKEPLAEAQPEEAGRPVSRRQFLKASTAAMASAGAVTVGTATALELRSTSAQDATPSPSVPTHAGMAEMETEQRAIQFFNIHEAATVDALVSRIFPGSADDPGAHEADVVFYIDQSLGGTNLGYTLKTYLQGPFPVVQEEPVSVEASSARDIYEYVAIAAEQLPRFGYQSVLTPQEAYRRGLAAVDAYSQTKFQNDFVDLDTGQQDEILTDMDNDEATGFEGPTGKAFFTRLRNDTIEGMFSDPMYGGNRDMVGWKLIGYPGAQRFYTPEDLQNPDFQREPQSLAMLMANEGH